MSVEAARDWAVWESSRGARATWFVQTNDADGGQPGPFYDAGLAATVRDIQSLGGELAAHTVVHDVAFESVPHGDGLEKRREYRPTTDAGRLWDETQTGEVRVPKEILDKDADAEVSGFRAPAQQFPEALDELLAAAGYSWDSSPSAARVLTHFPYLLTRGRGMSAASRVVELPMTFDDELILRGAVPPSSDAILRAFDAISAEEGVVVWQSKPSPENLPRLEEVLRGLPRGARVETLGTAARWWGARERVNFWLERGPARGPRTLRMNLPPDADGADLSFETSGPVASCRSLTSGVEVSCSGRTIRLLRTGGARAAALAFQLE